MGWTSLTTASACCRPSSKNLKAVLASAPSARGVMRFRVYNKEALVARLLPSLAPVPGGGATHCTYTRLTYFAVSN